MLIETGTLAEAALPLAALKAHLRLGTGFGDEDLQDEVLLRALRAAIAAIEARTGKAMLSRGFRLRLTAWRDPAGQPLPVAPVNSVTAVTYFNAAATPSLLDPARWRLVIDTHRPQLAPASALLPPVPTGGAVEIDFIAGFGADWADVPADLAQAVLILAAHLYERRGGEGDGAGAMPGPALSLAARWIGPRGFRARGQR